jgi:ABC-type transport system involved in multi-copper enzyme maturation permease subunit
MTTTIPAASQLENQRPNFGPVLRSEWTKLRSIRSNTWWVVGIVVLTVLFTALLAYGGHTDANQTPECLAPGATRGCAGDDDVVVNALRGVYLGQVLVVVFGALTITTEYTTGLIRLTFLAVPRRGRVLAAKAIIVSSAVLLTSALANAVAFVLAQPLLQGGGFEPPAYPLMTLSDPVAMRAVAGSAVYMTALSLIGVGIGTVMRNTSAAITLLTSLVLLPLATGWMLTGTVREAVLSVLPTAGLEIQRTVDGPAALALGPWGGLAVTAAWAVVSLLAAWWSISRRDV